MTGIPGEALAEVALTRWFNFRICPGGCRSGCHPKVSEVSGCEGVVSRK